MREMRDSGIEWIGVIPESWKIGKIKNYFDVTLGKMIQTAPIEPTETLENYLCAANIKWGGIDTSINKQMWFSRFEKKQYYLLDGDLIVMEGGTAGTASVYHGEFKPCYMQNSVNRCRTKGSFLNQYLYYWLFHIFYVGYIPSICNKATIMHFTKEKLERTPLLIPSIQEQKAISSFLNSKCAEIDALSADIQSEIDTLEAYKRSVITEAVTKGLDKNVPMKESGIEWAEFVPDHWKIMQNKYIMKKIKRICSVYNGENILSLTMNGVIVRDLDAGGKMPASFDGYQWVHSGNLLMCLFDYDVTPRCIGLIKNDGLTSPAYSQFIMKNRNSANYYYYYYLMIDFTKELLHLAKNLRHSFTEDQLGVINTPVPPVNEQIAIANYLDKVCLDINSVISQKQEQLSILADYKKSIIFEYVTGKKEVPTA